MGGKNFFYIFLFSFGAQASTFVPSQFQIKFVQSFKSVVSGKVKKSKGQIDYRYPGSIRFKEFKSNTEFVSNPRTSWYYSPPFIKGEKGTVQVNSGKRFVIGRLFDALKNGLKSNAQYRVKSLKKSVYELTFLGKTADELNLKKAFVYFSGKSLNSLKGVGKMKLMYQDGKKVDFLFETFKDDISFSEAHFVFSIPKNTKVAK